MEFASHIEQWRPLVTRYFGAENADRALWVIQHESSGRAGVVNPKSGAAGLFQILPSVHGNGNWTDPEANVAYAAKLFKQQGWKPWGGDGNTYQGKPFGALGAHPFPAELQVSSSSTSTPTSSGRTAMLPVQGGRTTAIFGPTNEKLDSAYNGYDHFNKGWDVSVPVGTQVLANVSGTVVSAGDIGDNWGTSIKIRDEDGYVHNYGHLSKVQVKAGDKITPGMQIALTGNTGAGTGPHLSYDVKDPSGKYIDPSPWLGFTAAGDNRQGVDPDAHRNASTEDTASGVFSEPSPQVANWQRWTSDADEAGRGWKVVNGGKLDSAVVQVLVPVETNASKTARAKWEEKYGAGAGDDGYSSGWRRGEEDGEGGIPPKPEKEYENQWVDDPEATVLYKQNLLAELEAESAAKRAASEEAKTAESYVAVDPSVEAASAFDSYMSRVKAFSDQSEREASQAQRGNEYNQRMTDAFRSTGGFGFSDLHVGTPREAKLSNMIQPYINEGIDDPDYIGLGDFNRSNFGMPFMTPLPGHPYAPKEEDEMPWSSTFAAPTYAPIDQVRGYATGTMGSPVLPDDMSDIPEHIRRLIGKGSIRVGVPTVPGIPTGVIEGVSA